MSRFFLFLGVSLFVACSYYDRSLLAPLDPGEPSEEAGAGGEAPMGGAGGIPAGGAGSGGIPAGGAGSGGSTNYGGSGGDPLGIETQLVGCGVKPIGPPKNAPAKKDGVEFVLAVKSLNFGEKKEGGEAAYLNYGFDLDGYCTCPDDVVCKGADPNPQRYCDGANGRDNAGGALVASFSTVLKDFNSDKISASALEGNSTFLFLVRNYNGEPDDDQVDVAWILGEDASKNGAVQWSGQDVWNAQKSSFKEDKKTPVVLDKNAYVRGNVLVATLPGGEIGSGDLSLILTAPLLVATLIPPDTDHPYWGVQSGTVAARWDTRNILGLLRRFNDPITKKPFCTDNPVYGNIKQEICAFADIPLGVQVQPNLPCDALSLALRFTAVEAKLGALVDVPPPINLCNPNNDPGEDSCN